MKTHELKTDPDQFQALLVGDKTFEFRYNDRKFLAGDELLLRETSYTAATMKERGLAASYTGRTLLFDVVGVCPLRNLFNYINIPTFWTGQLQDWVVLSIRPKGKPAHHVEPREPWLRPARSEITPGSRRPSIARVKRVAGDDSVDVTYHLDGLSPEGEREVYKRVANYLAGMDTKPPGIKPDLPEECSECDIPASEFKDLCRRGEGCTTPGCPMMKAQEKAQEKAEERALEAWSCPLEPYPQGGTVERFRAELEPQDREFLINLAKYIKGEISEAILRQK